MKNPLQVLKAKSEEAWSGCIEVAEPKDASVSWQVYLLEGKIQYVTTTAGQQTRLNFLWQRFKLNSDCPKLVEQGISEYSQICQWLSNKQLTDGDIKKLLFQFTREGMGHVLSIEQTNIQLISAKYLQKSLISFELKTLESDDQIKKLIKAWKEIRSYLPSPMSRFYLEQKNALQFYQLWKKLYTNADLAPLVQSQKVSSFVSLFVAKINLYQIATRTNLNTWLLAKYLKQSVVDNIVNLLPFEQSKSYIQIVNEVNLQENNINTQNSNFTSKQVSASNDEPKTLIVCIDDSKAVQIQVKMTLETAGYQVIGILDPTMTLKNLSHHQPSVIFMDINMPNMNGYDLCSLLKKTKKFKEIPIVMLTGRDGMIDRVRAKLAGATDYLIKPCDPNKLITLAKMLEKTVISSV